MISYDLRERALGRAKLGFAFVHLLIAQQFDSGYLYILQSRLALELMKLALMYSHVKYTK